MAEPQSGRAQPETGSSARSPFEEPVAAERDSATDTKMPFRWCTFAKFILFHLHDFKTSTSPTYAPFVLLLAFIRRSQSIGAAISIGSFICCNLISQHFNKV